MCQQCANHVAMHHTAQHQKTDEKIHCCTSVPAKASSFFFSDNFDPSTHSSILCRISGSGSWSNSKSRDSRTPLTPTTSSTSSRRTPRCSGVVIHAGLPQEETSCPNHLNGLLSMLSGGSFPSPSQMTDPSQPSKEANFWCLCL